MLVGLGYQARAGKDTVADHLVKVSCHNFKKIGFATALKRAAQCIFGLTHRQVNIDKAEIDPFWEDTPRNILQKLGTECLRDGYRKDVWIKALFRYIGSRSAVDDQAGVTTSWVISDVRFPDEAAAIKAAGGYLMRIDRPELGDGVIATKRHASETSLIGYTGWDHVLLNDGDVDDLLHKVDDWMLGIEVLKGWDHRWK